MKIGNTANTPNVAPVGQPATRGASEGARPGGAAPTGQAGEASATVSLSGAAKALLDGVDPADGSFDAQKVEQVRQAIADGRYQVNADVIADKLLANAQEILGRGNPAR